MSTTLAILFFSIFPSVRFTDQFGGAVNGPPPAQAAALLALGLYDASDPVISQLRAA